MPCVPTSTRPGSARWTPRSPWCSAGRRSSRAVTPLPARCGTIRWAEAPRPLATRTPPRRPHPSRGRRTDAGQDPRPPAGVHLGSALAPDRQNAQRGGDPEGRHQDEGDAHRGQRPTRQADLEHLGRGCHHDEVVRQARPEDQARIQAHGVRRPIHEGVGATAPAVLRHRTARRAARARPRAISTEADTVEPDVLGVSGAMATVIAITVERATIHPTTYATSLASPPRVATRMMPASTDQGCAASARAMSRRVASDAASMGGHTTVRAPCPDVDATLPAVPCRVSSVAEHAVREGPGRRHGKGSRCD